MYPNTATSANTETTRLNSPMVSRTKTISAAMWMVHSQIGEEDNQKKLQA